MSRQELDALPPSSRDDNRHLREFVKDNFDTISQLNTDGTFFELGISRRDAAALFASRSVAIESARGSYVSHYSQVGADTGATIGFGVGMAAQAADLTLLGGAITETSMLMHLGAGIGYPIATTGGLDAGAIVVAPIAGAFWGPLHTSVGGYYAGQALGSRIAQIASNAFTFRNWMRFTTKSIMASRSDQGAYSTLLIKAPKIRPAETDRYSDQF